MIGRALLLSLLLVEPVMAQGITDASLLAIVHVRVTGTRLETRQDGIQAAFRLALVKLSGDPGLADDPRVAMLDPLAPTLVDDIAYQDILSDEPKHDEQGTRDRPYDLKVAFNPRRIGGVLELLGEKMLLVRPPVLVRINIDDHGAQFPLSADGDPDERQREAVLAAADRFGLRVILTANEGEPSAPAPPTAVTLAGRMAWSDAAAGWVGKFSLSRGGRLSAWSIEGVSFDEAYRNAMGTTLAILAGHDRK